MKRYYFDLRNGDDLYPDEEGMELPDLRSAQEEAARALADMARDEMRAFSGNGAARRLVIEVRDDSGPVLQARFTYDVQKLQ